MIFIETSRFTELVKAHLSDDEYSAFQWLLFERPDAGSIVSGSGGVRKIRWGLCGSGKRGGIRIIYYWKKADGEIWLLTLYAKNERSTIPGHILKQIALEIDDE
jgi:mRNA-degrading endonuclease RelE of RelBE toxin-antitoxin system